MCCRIKVVVKDGSVGEREQLIVRIGAPPNPIPLDGRVAGCGRRYEVKVLVPVKIPDDRLA